MNNKISLVINTKNEELNLADCIKSAKKLADEIVVVDMCSTDRTVEIAREMGARTYKVKDYDIVGPARQFAVSKAKNEWVFLLDADERLTLRLIKKFRRIVDDDMADVVKIPFKNIIFGKWIEHTFWWPDYHERLFKKSFIRWPDKKQPHQRPKLSGRILELPAQEGNAVIHYNYKNISQFVNRMNRYTSHEGHLKSKSKMSVEEMFEFFEKEYVHRYIWQEGYLDGMHGFILSKLMEFYRFLEVAKQWENEGYKEWDGHENIRQFTMQHYKPFFITDDVLKIKDHFNEIALIIKRIIKKKMGVYGSK